MVARIVHPETEGAAPLAPALRHLRGTPGPPFASSPAPTTTGGCRNATITTTPRPRHTSIRTSTGRRSMIVFFTTVSGEPWAGRKHGDPLAASGRPAASIQVSGGRGSEWFANHGKLRRLRRPTNFRPCPSGLYKKPKSPQTRAERQTPGRPLPHLPHVRKMGLPTSFPACPKMGQLHAPLPANDVPSS